MRGNISFSARAWQSSRLLGGLLLTGVCMFSGCSKPSDTPSEAASAAQPVPPPASVERPATADPEPQGAAAMIAEIARLRTLPDTVIEVRYENGERSEESVRAPTEEEISAEQLRRCERIVELAAAAIQEVHADPEREQLFNNAVHYLSDARMQLALLGQAEQAQLLAEDAQALFDRDPTSFAAVESGYKVVQLAESMAARHGAGNPEWITAYANQARLFADRFPQEQGRSAVSLIAAGRKCEQFSLHQEARQCYLLVEQLYPDSAFTAQIAGILRRLRLVGQPLDLAGPTIDGGFFKLEDFADKPILVVFWSSNSETFRRDLPVIKEITSAYGEGRLTVVGVNLDEDEFAVDAFLESSGINWRQIFFSEPDKRGGRNPVARYYGVHVVPTYWLTDATGKVVAAPAGIETLAGGVAQVVGDSGVRAASAEQPAAE